MLKLKRKTTCFILCVTLIFVFATSAYANNKEMVTYHSDQIVPAENILFDQSARIIYPSGEATEATNGVSAPKMGTGVKLFSATASNLGAGKLLTTLTVGNEKYCFKRNFPNGAAVIWSNLTSSSSSNVRVGFCRVDSSGNFVADVYTNVTANGKNTKYPSVTNMNANATYYGFINNLTSSSVSGTVDFGYLD